MSTSNTIGELLWPVCFKLFMHPLYKKQNECVDKLTIQFYLYDLLKRRQGWIALHQIQNKVCEVIKVMVQKHTAAKGLVK